MLLKKSDDAELIFFSDRDYAIELSDTASMMFLYKLSIAVQTAKDEIGRNANVRLCLIKMAMNSNVF